MSQTRTLILTLGEEHIDAAINAIKTDHEAAMDNITDMTDLDEQRSELDYADALGETLNQFGSAWEDASPKQLQKASELLQTDWDADGSTPIYLPRPQALALLQKLGWSIEERKTRASTVRAGFPATYNLYTSPDGSTSTPELDEALTLALVGLALGGGQS